MEYLPLPTKSNSNNDNKERAVWNVGQRLRGKYVRGVCVCVCVRVHGVGRQNSPETASGSVMCGRLIAQNRSWKIN